MWLSIFFIQTDNKAKASKKMKLLSSYSHLNSGTLSRLPVNCVYRDINTYPLCVCVCVCARALALLSNQMFALSSRPTIWLQQTRRPPWNAHSMLALITVLFYFLHLLGPTSLFLPP